MEGRKTSDGGGTLSHGIQENGGNGMRGAGAGLRDRFDRIVSTTAMRGALHGSPTLVRLKEPALCSVVLDLHGPLVAPT